MPMLPVYYPDAQFVIVEYLRPLLGSMPIGVRIPEVRPDRFVSVRRVGGNASALLDTARVDIYAWDTTDVAAFDTVNAIRRHIAVIGASVDAVADVQEFAGPIPVPDESGQPRWLITYELTLRGSAG